MASVSEQALTRHKKAPHHKGGELSVYFDVIDDPGLLTLSERKPE